MYVPPVNAMEHGDVRAFVADVGAGHLVTVGADGLPYATQLPVVWTGDIVHAHLAVQNPHADMLRDGDEALLVIAGPQGYVTPRWYAAKQTHGRVVPTWNYSTVHLRGSVTVVRDADALLESVSRLTDQHERAEPHAWRVDDAPEAFTRGQLRGIVGVEITVRDVQAKDKLSQNRSDADRARVADGMERRGDGAVADRMRRASGT